jgi:hypothetical protein
MRLTIEFDSDDEADRPGQIIYDALRSEYTTVGIPVDETGRVLEVLEEPVWTLRNLVDDEV